MTSATGDGRVANENCGWRSAFVVVRRSNLTKNLDIAQELDGFSLPLELFEGPPKKPEDIEKICKEKCPVLSNKIVVAIDRIIIRTAGKPGARKSSCCKYLVQL